MESHICNTELDTLTDYTDMLVLITKIFRVLKKSVLS